MKLPLGAVAGSASSGEIFLAVILDKFLLHREHGYPLAGEEGGGFGAPAQHIEPVFRVSGDGHRHEESVAAANFLPAYGMAVVESNRRCGSNHDSPFGKMDSRFRGNNGDNATEPVGVVRGGLETRPCILAWLSDEAELLVSVAENGLIVQAHPLVQQFGVGAAEVVVPMEVALVQLGRLQGRGTCHRCRP